MLVLLINFSSHSIYFRVALIYTYRHLHIHVRSLYITCVRGTCLLLTTTVCSIFQDTFTQIYHHVTSITIALTFSCSQHGIIIIEM